MQDQPQEPAGTEPAPPVALQATAPPVPPPATTTQPPKKSNTKWWIIGGCGCLFLLCAMVSAIIGFAALLPVDGDVVGEAPVIAQLDALEAGKTRQAYDATSQSFKDNTTYEDFQKWVEERAQVFDIKRYEITGTKDQGKNKLVTVKVTGVDGSWASLEFIVSDEGGAWKVAGISEPMSLKKSSAKPSETMDEFMAALAAGDLKGAYDKFTSKNFQSQSPASDLGEVTADNPELVKRSSSMWTYIDKGDTATANGTIVGTNGRTVKVEATLVKEDGAWKIDSFVPNP